MRGPLQLGEQILRALAAVQRGAEVRLAGRAPVPEFFEIDDSLVEPAADGADMPRLTG